MTKKVCMIGAGASGIVSVKTLKEQGIPFDCFEMGSDIGGNWRYNNDNGRSAAYDALHIDTSKDRMAFSDFPMPDHYPNYPHHTQVLDYFERYVAHFGLRPSITFHTKVTNVAPAPGGGYHVSTTNLQTGDSQTAHYGAVLVCNGHHWNSKWPHFPGSFSGRCLHSQEYRNSQGLEGKNVLVVGIGNSGVDIACDTARVTQQTFLSTRRSAHIVPRFILGRPTDKWITPFGSRFPLAVQRFVYRILLYLARGRQENYGVPLPQHQLLSEHPTMSADLLNLTAHGEITIKPNIKALAGDRVHFVDGSEAQIDVIIYATGYEITFPFFAPNFIQLRDNHFPLYRKVIHPEHPHLYFIGLIQPLGAIMPLAEAQVKWVAALLKGEALLPSKPFMQRAMAKEQAALERRYVASTRHTIQVDFYPYKRLIEREIVLGKARLRRARKRESLPT